MLRMHHLGGVSMATAKKTEALSPGEFIELMEQARTEFLGDQSPFRGDGVGNQTACTYPGARRIETTYDELERKGTITDTSGGGSALIATMYMLAAASVASQP